MPRGARADGPLADAAWPSLGGTGVTVRGPGAALLLRGGPFVYLGTLLLKFGWGAWRERLPVNLGTAPCSGLPGLGTLEPAQEFGSPGANRVLCLPRRPCMACSQ